MAGNKGLFLVLPAGTTFVAAWTADGNPTEIIGGGATGLDYVAVALVSGRVTFSKVC